MNDPYLYESSSVLRNLLNILDEKELNIAEAELSQANMMLLYENGFLDSAWKAINKIKWHNLSREDFAAQIARMFPLLWQVHPFREGNTRTIIMLMTFFVEHYDYYFDKELLAASAGYVRNALVMASLGQYSEFEHLEKILLDAICTEPIEYTDDLDQEESVHQDEKYQKYKTDYKPVAHEYRADDEENKN
jgi:cell filamentation protein